MTLRRFLSLALASSMVLGAQSTGSADDHSPPMALLRIRGFPERGRVVSVDWVHRKDGRCVERRREGDLRFGPATRVDLGAHPARLRLLTPRRPRLRIVTWILADDQRHPLGPAEEIPFELEPLARNGRTLAWDAVFSFLVLEHRYFAVFARWPDREGCDQMQRATWTYHVRGL